MNFLYANYPTTEIEEFLNANPCMIKFVRELHHTFGLTAYKLTNSKRIALCNDKGIHIAEAYLDQGYDHNNNKTEEYCYYTPWYQKQRGRSEVDRRTLTSIKLSSLIANMKRNDVVPTPTLCYKIFKDVLDDAMGNVRQSISMKKSHKSSYDVDTEVYHKMLKIVLDNQQDLVISLDKIALQKTLDEFNEIDKKLAERDKAVNDKFLSQEFYAISVDEHRDYLVARMGINMVKDSNGEDGFAADVKEMKRVYSLTESYPELVPLLTMHKVAREKESDRVLENNDNWLFFTMDRYDTDFDFNFVNSRRGYQHVQWLFIPCSAI